MGNFIFCAVFITTVKPFYLASSFRFCFHQMEAKFDMRFAIQLFSKILRKTPMMCLFFSKVTNTKLTTLPTLLKMSLY